MCAHPFSMRPLDVQQLTLAEFDLFATSIDDARKG